MGSSEVELLVTGLNRMYGYRFGFPSDVTLTVYKSEEDHPPSKTLLLPPPTFNLQYFRGPTVGIDNVDPIRKGTSTVVVYLPKNRLSTQTSSPFM